jgi:tRNA-splicing ligase RtcB (3'-phosphate/5'-hydroxy nucleic acid ligase)
VSLDFQFLPVVTESVHNHHNYAWRERHGGRDLWVVRKGATPAFPGQRGFVGGSMGDDAVIVEGIDGDEARASLYSTVHGAGRLFGRRPSAGSAARKWMHGCGAAGSS